jgi:hypothetical protein
LPGQGVGRVSSRFTYRSVTGYAGGIKVPIFLGFEHAHRYDGRILISRFAKEATVMRSLSLFSLMVFLVAVILNACSKDSTSDADGDQETAEQVEQTDTEADPPIDGDMDFDPEPDLEPEQDVDKEPDIEPEIEEELETEQESPYENLPPIGQSLRDILGVSTHMKQDAGENADRDFEFERYVELGGASIREDYHWHKIEPTDDEWHFEVVETQAQMASERNMKIVAMLAYGVDWAMSDGTTDSIDPADYGDFAGHVAEHFCDTIKDYEIWNEPNITRFWTPAPNPAKYGSFLKAAYTAIKSACPDARVYYGGVCSYSTDDISGDWGFIEDSLAAHPDLCEYMDAIAIHPYTLMQKPSPEWDAIYSESLRFRNQSALTELAREKFAAGGCGEYPLILSEMGWPSYELTEDEQGYFLARSVLLAARDKVVGYYWYTFWDGYPTTEGIRPHEDYFGLFGWRGEDGTVRRPKPAWSAMLGLANILGDYSFVREISRHLELPTDVYVLVFKNADGQIALAAWDGRDNPDEGIDPPMEGGPETLYFTDIPVPEGYTTAQIFDINGTLVETRSLDVPFNLSLSRAVQYVHFITE